MRRRLLRLMATLSLVTLAGATTMACDPGVYEDEKPDAGGNKKPDAGTTPPTIDAGSACEPLGNTTLSGRHNAGTSCQNCHGSGVGGAPIFTLGGTLYGTPNGVGAIAGATVVVTDANGQVQKLTSATNGNFWSIAPMAYPIQVSASNCPDTKPMLGAVSAQGDCNSVGCHAQNAPSGRVHLP